MMSSEESLYSDADGKNNNNKSKSKHRKPDMQVYVPRAKRIEDQVKQRMSAESAVVGGGAAAVVEPRGRFSLSPSPEHAYTKVQTRKGFKPSWDEREFMPSKIKPKDSNNGGKAAVKAISEPVSARKGAAPQQPQTNKLPSQVIQEMMKRHNINMPDIAERPFPKNETAFPVEQSPEPKIGTEEAAAGAILVHSEGDSSILNYLPGSYQDFVNEEIALSAAAASQRFAASTQSVSMSESDQILSSSASESGEGQQKQQLPFRERGSPCLDPEDLEVKMINESFEEAQRQMQLLGSEAVKKAWNAADKQPRSILDAATAMLTPTTEKPPSTASAVTASSAMSTGTLSKTGTVPDFPVEPVVSAIGKKPVVAGTTSSTGNVTSGGSGKLTWAGWGAKKGNSMDRDESATSAPKTVAHAKEYGVENSSVTSSVNSSTVGASTGSEPTPPCLMPYFVSSGSHSASSIELPQDTAHQSAGIIGGILDVNDTQEMDILSAAMVEKVLSGEENDFDMASQEQRRSTRVTSRDDDADAAAAARPGLPFTSHEGGRQALADIWSRNEGADISAGANTSAVDSWEDLFGESGEKLIAQMMQEAKTTSAKAEPDELCVRQEIDYFTIKPKRVEVSEEEFSHVLEAYGFPSSVKGDQLYLSLKQRHCRDFKIEWVNETHALVIFASAVAAREACDTVDPLIKLRPMSAASAASKMKVKTTKDVLQPYVQRPDTSAVVARRLVEGHLGKRSELNSGRRRLQMEQLQQAREEKKRAAQQREDAWEGRL